LKGLARKSYSIRESRSTMNGKGFPPGQKTRWDFHPEETYKSLITISVEALKLLALVNGGAAVAILAYLGNLASRVTVRRVPNMTGALLFFAGGLLLTILAFIASYLTQLRLFNEDRIADGIIESRAAAARTFLSLPKQKWWPRLKARFALLEHFHFLSTAFVLMILATCAFAVGCVIAALKFAGA
jgi:hypothetical protein